LRLQAEVENAAGGGITRIEVFGIARRNVGEENEPTLDREGEILPGKHLYLFIDTQTTIT
jgi:hypothetical protein